MSVDDTGKSAHCKECAAGDRFVVQFKIASYMDMNPRGCSARLLFEMSCVLAMEAFIQQADNLMNGFDSNFGREARHNAWGARYDLAR